jgi:murein DD-endopeptidase MepM/ murein hydrolase activator NlpD
VFCGGHHAAAIGPGPVISLWSVIVRFLGFVVTVVLLTPTLSRAADAPLDIRFCPSGHVHAYPLDTRHHLESLVLQNTVIINRSTAAIVITAIDFDVMQNGRTIETRAVQGDNLAREAQNGSAVSGVLKDAPFLFCGGRSVAADIKLAGPLLAADQAMLVFQQLLVFQGKRDTVRVTVHALAGSRAVDTRAFLPIFTGLSKTVFRFPLKGVWYIEQGATPHNGHRWAPMEEFALDIGKIGGNGLDHRGQGDKFIDYYGYGAQVVAAADGRVIVAVDDVPEDSAAMRHAGESMDAYMKRLMQDQAVRMQRGSAALIGNHVVIDHGDGEYSLYAHMQPGSVHVKLGDEVKAGQPIGKLGSSGNSTAPHLHFQVCDGPNPLDCAGIPIAFKDIELPLGDFPRPVQSGDIVEVD